MKKPDYVAIAKEYMRGVLDGSVPACSFVKQAVQRQLNDLRRWGAEGGDYYFDEKEASRPCWFIENLTHTKGGVSGQGDSPRALAMLSPDYLVWVEGEGG